MNEPTGVFSAIVDFAADGNRNIRKILLQFCWVVIVSGLLGYILGALTIFGIAAPFAKAADMEALQRTVLVSARINIAQEIRVQVRAWCAVSDQSVKDAIARTLDTLQDEYQRVAGSRYPQPGCQ